MVICRFFRAFGSFVAPTLLLAACSVTQPIEAPRQAAPSGPGADLPQGYPAPAAQPSTAPYPAPSAAPVDQSYPPPVQTEPTATVTETAALETATPVFAGQAAVLSANGTLSVITDGAAQVIAEYGAGDYTDADLVWSPDGWRLATPNGIYTFGAPDQPPVLAPISGFKYRWRPDGQQVAFMAALGEDNDSLIVGGPDGDAAQVIEGAHWSLAGLPDWSPDGTIVIAGATQNVPHNTGQLPEERGQDATWAPDGAAIAWTGVEDDGATITKTLTLWDGAQTRSNVSITVRRATPDANVPWATVGFDPPRLRWLPGGSALLVAIPHENLASGGGTYLVQPDGALRYLSTAVITDLAPDGQRMLARTADNRIVVAQVADGEIEAELGPGVMAAWRPATAGAPPSAPLAAKSPTLRLNEPRAQGAAVRELQQRLADLKLDVGPVDGVFGPQTEGAVRAFQQQNGLEVDGIVGPKTWAALRFLDWTAGNSE